MRSFKHVITIVILFFGVSSLLQSQAEIVYENPTVGLRFMASPNWTLVANHTENSGIEYMNANQNMSLKMWYTRSEKPIFEFLKDEVCESGKSGDRDPFLTRIDGQQAYGIHSFCSEMRRPYKVTLIAVPDDQGMYLIRIKCPEDCYQQHKDQMQEVLNSISILKPEEQSMYYLYYAVNSALH